MPCPRLTPRPSEQLTGAANRADGFTDGPVRISRQGAAVITDAHGRYYEGARLGQTFSLVLTATNTGIGVGNIAGAPAASSTQFALLNPPNSGKNLVLLKFGMGVISGTPPGGPLYHGYLPNVSLISNLNQSTGTIRSNLMGNAAVAAALPWARATGFPFTGGMAPVAFRVADFAATATAQAVANGHVRCIEELAGDLIVPPDTGWVPLWSNTGTALLNSYSITWEEVPL